MTASSARKNRTKRIVMSELRGESPFGGERPLGNPRIWLAVIAALYLILAIWYNAAIPAATASQHQPDENGHMLYIHRLAAGRLPVFGSGGDGPEAHEPPLYYMVATPLYLATKSMGEASATHAERFLSTLIGLAIILVIYMATIDVLGDARIALGAAAVVAFLPMQIDMSAAVTNDGLLNLVFAIVLWRLARMLIRLDRARDPSPTPRECLFIGMLIGIGFWVKSQAALLIPATIVAFGIVAYRHRATAKSTITGGLAALVLGIIIASPWLIRNDVLYGDPFGGKRFTRVFSQTTATEKKMETVAAAYLIQQGEPNDDNLGGKAFNAYMAFDAKWTFASFFGVFDSMRLFWGQDPARKFPNIFDPLPAVYDVILALCLIAAGGLVWFLVRRKPKLTVGQSSSLWVFAVVVGSVAYAFFWFNMTFFQAQGRYWYPALLPLAVFAALGLRGLAPKAVPYTVVTIALAVLQVALNVYTLISLFPVRFAV